MEDKEMRQDIRNCFKVCSDLDEKYDKRYRELQHDVSDLTTDLKLTVSSVNTLAKGLEQYVEKLDKHSKEEGRRYEEIKLQQAKFIRFFWIATGSVSTILAIGSLVAWLISIIIDLKGI